MKKPLILLTLAAGLCYGGECKGRPDVCAWNEAMVQMKAYADAETEFSGLAQEWIVAKQAEISDAGTISSEALKKFSAMWAAWQRLREAFKKADKAFHDFSVVEMNK